MREIKFRAWVKDGKEIKKIYGDDIEIVSCDIGVYENGI